MHFAKLAAVAIGICVASVTPSMAQDRAQSLADVRQDLSMLYVEVQKLRVELSTTQGANVSSGTGSLTERVSAIESELSRLTGKTEQLEFRINSIVKDGTNRIGDLEFRLVELEGGDISKLGETTTLGGDVPSSSTTAAAPSSSTSSQSGGGEMAVAERQDFESAAAALKAGDFATAATRFENFALAYPGGPLTNEAHFQRGEALKGNGDIKGSARAYLTSFSGAPQSDRAPDALYELGSALGSLGQQSEACATLAEVSKRFPSAPAASNAQSKRASLGCQ